MNCPHCGKSIEKPEKNTNFSETDIKRFWRQVVKSDGCWNFTGNPSHKYGRMGINGKEWLAHLASWVIHGGKLELGKVLAHSCDNPKCVRPDHLEFKTQSENIQDAVDRNRIVHKLGEQNAFSKIKDAEVFEIRDHLKNKTKSIKQIAQEKGVTFQCIYRIGMGNQRGTLEDAVISVQNPEKLSVSDVLEIKRLCMDGVLQRRIAEKFKIHQGHVSAIKHGRRHSQIFEGAASILQTA